ncbi:hypothetical protein IKP85_04340 [bacterium]|nr:hypothetical protein [bacterium]
MRKFITENKYLTVLWVLCGLALILFCGHYGNIVFDIGREIYYPERILDGKVLYKDLFNIYGPFPYLFNALLYKIFTVHLNTLYVSGALCSFGIVSGVYIISRKFLSEFLSFAIGVFVIICGVCATHLFNYTLPYSYGMLYGTVAFIYSVWAYLKFQEKNNQGFLYLAALLGGIAFSNKYDFIVYGIVLFIASLFTRNKRIVLNFITCFMFVPVICGIILFIQGLGLNDISYALADIKSLAEAKTLKYFYTIQGIYFSSKVLPVWLFNFIQTVLGFGIIAGGIKITEKNKFIGYVIAGIGSIAFIVFSQPAVFVYIAPLIILTALTVFTKLKTQSGLLFLTIAVLSVCIKCFWVMLPLNYGNYALPAALCVLMSLLFTVVDRKYEKAFAIGIIAVSLNILIANSNRLFLSDKISTDRGNIYTYSEIADATNNLIAGLETSDAKSAVIYPEGLLVNFLTGIKSDDYYNSMLPLYIESIGEDRFLKSLKENNPEYIVLNNQSTYEYGAEHITKDYAYDFGKYLQESYEPVEDIDRGFRYIVFKRK